MAEENERRWTVVDDLGVQKILQSATLLIFYFKDRVKQCSQLTKKQVKKIFTTTNWNLI